MFGPEYCFPIRLESDGAPEESVIAVITEAARQHGAAIRIDARRTDEALVRATIEACGRAHGGSTLALLAPSGLVEATIRNLGTGGLHIVTVSVGDTDTHESLARLAEAVFERELVLEFDLPAGSELLEAQLDRLGAWRTLRPGDTTYRLRGGELAIAGDGRIDFRDAAGQLRRSACGIQEVGIDAALATLGLDLGAFGFADGSVHLPLVYRVPEPDDSGRAAYWGGGSQAFGQFLAQEEARAALGFHSKEHAAYDQWLEPLAGVTADAGTFPAFPWGHPDYGVVVADGIEKVVAPPRNGRSHPALVIAAWLAQGRLDEVEYCLGVRLEPPTFGDERKRPVDDLSDADRKHFASRAAALLARAVQIVAMSRIAQEQRAAAVAVLPTLATHEANRAAEQLADCLPELAGPVHRKFRKRATQTRLKRGKDPAVALRHLKDGLAQLAEIFGGRGGRNG